MSYFAKNLQRFARELLSGPPQRIPARLAAAAEVKLKTATEQLLDLSGAGRLIGRSYRGPGLVLMFHEIHDNVEAQLRTGCSPQQLRRTLLALKADDRDIVTADEALRRLADPQARKFAVLTFDDGYRDNRDLALPILAEFAAPMTMFVPTGMVTRELYAWWLGLRDLLQRLDSVDIQAMERRFDCADPAQKNAAMRQITAWVGTDRARAAALGDTFREHHISLADLIDKVAMDERELKTFADHPLVTIGGHTTTHTFLTGLSDQAAYADIADNRQFLEGLLCQPVRHFAYPYGTAGACGAREAGYVRAAGYDSGFTTRPGQLFPEHLLEPQLMPREDAGFANQTKAQLESRINGARRALETRFGDPVAGIS
ncbi:MAG: polysaccharide deacetylase family protein [Allorhizobium sp.]